MTHRERVLTALRHQEPDRVPIDFGGSAETTILAVAYRRLREYLGLPVNIVRVDDPCQHTAVVDRDVQQRFGVDTQFVFHEPTCWRGGVLPDGSPADFPALFRPVRRDDGLQVTLDEENHVLLLMPEGGQYFDPVYAPLADAAGIDDIDRHLAAIEAYDRPPYFDMSYEDLGSKAHALHEHTDDFLIGYFGGHIFQAAQVLRGWATFLSDLLINRKFAEALLARLADANVRRFEQFAATIGPHVDAVIFEDDLGAQDRPLVSPEMYRAIIKPHHRRLYGFARSRCQAHILLHSDGAVAPLIPDFIDMGIDALNPIQVSAKGMDTAWLKREFGASIAFWGGGCDSQHVLPFGTPGQVADEVKRRIDDLAPGGGFVFASIHNVQTGVPPENVVAMFDTAQAHGVYR